MNVDAGPEFKYGALEIRGLDVISEPAIRKMWGAKEGKPFDAEYPDAFLKDVRDQGLFDNLGDTSAQTKVNEDRKTVDVTLIFLGSKPAGPGRRATGHATLSQARFVSPVCVRPSALLPRGRLSAPRQRN